MRTIAETIPEERLIELIRERWPSRLEELEILRKHFADKTGYSAFAPIRGECCGACKMKIATAGIQMARRGRFISCANCSRILYAAEILSIDIEGE